jgi:CheY-like chemotaxis protein
MPTVLIVDDMRVFADVVGAKLEKSGYEVLVAGDGQEALRLVRQNRPSLVILDIAMPIMGGIDALRALRQDPDPAVSQMQILVVTGSSRPDQQAEAGRLGVQGHLLKGRFSLVELVERVRDLVPLC